MAMTATSHRRNGRDGLQLGVPFDTGAITPRRAMRQGLKNVRLRPRRRSDRIFRTSGFQPSEMIRAFEGTADRFVALVRSLPPHATAKPVPGLTWTVGDLVAHEVTVLRRARDPRRAATLEDLAVLNQACIDEVATRDLQELADRLEREVALGAPIRRALPSLWRLGVGRWLTFRLHFGIESDIPMALGWPLADMLVHGYELAEATGTRWVIEPVDAAIALRAGLPQLETWVNPTVLNGDPRQHSFGLTTGGPSIEMATGAGLYGVALKDGHATPLVEPAALLLAVMGRGDRTTTSAIVDDIASWFEPI